MRGHGFTVRMTRRRRDAEPDGLLFLSVEQCRARFGREPEDGPDARGPVVLDGAWPGWGMTWPPPSVVLVMAECGGTTLWNRSPARHPWADDYVLDPTVLGLSEALARRLGQWNEPLWAGRDIAAWVEEGGTLAHHVQRDFDSRGLDVEVRYHDRGGDEPAVRGGARRRRSCQVR